MDSGGRQHSIYHRELLEMVEGAGKIHIAVPVGTDAVELVVCAVQTHRARKVLHYIAVAARTETAHGIAIYYIKVATLAAADHHVRMGSRLVWQQKYSACAQIYIARIQCRLVEWREVI